MPKINVHEPLKILVWFLSLSNIFREQHEHFLGPFWRNFYLDHFQKWFWGFHKSPFQVSDERVNMMQHSNAWLARVWQLTPTQKNLVPRFGFLREEGGILKSKTILPFPSCFILRMVRPLNFEKLDIMTSGGTFGLIEDTNGVLSIRKIILEIKRFMVHSTDRIREATPELRNVEDIMNSRKMWG